MHSNLTSKPLEGNTCTKTVYSCFNINKSLEALLKIVLAQVKLSYIALRRSIQTSDLIVSTKVYVTLHSFWQMVKFSAAFLYQISLTLTDRTKLIFSDFPQCKIKIA